MKLTALAAIAACCLSMNSSAADWHEIGGGTKSTVYIDKNSITAASPDRLKAWILFNFSEPQLTTDYPKVTYKSSMQLSTFSCSKRTLVALQEILYVGEMQEGGVARSDSFKFKEENMLDVAPGTLGETWMEYACKTRRKK